MEFGKVIRRIRAEAKMTQAQFSELFGVSQQSVQKWENGLVLPGLDKMILISKHFGVSLDALVLGNGNRVVEEMKQTKRIVPQYENIHDWEFYSSNLATEYCQSVEEGLDIEAYQDLFMAAARLPKGEIKKKQGDVLFAIVSSAKMKEGYPYVEPSELDAIWRLRQNSFGTADYDQKAIAKKLHGAWMGRVCGCMLGKTVEGVRTDELVPFLMETGNYPMHRYIYKTDLNDQMAQTYRYGFHSRDYVDQIDGMPADDDTNYTVLAQEVVEKYTRDFTSANMAQAWISYQPKDAYCTAERVAFCNFVKGYAPPQSAVYQNPYREWIGAQIRGDYFGYINPGDPKTAAEMAWRDASISHIKNGIYGEMFVAAMLAVAATTSDIRQILLGGLGEIPYTSRLYESVSQVMEWHQSGIAKEECFKRIHNAYDEYTEHGWCHTISNAMIVAASLLYGEGDFGKSICMAVETGFDTDCNGATVGSVLGMVLGFDGIPLYWKAPFGDKLNTTIFGIHQVKISECAQKTLRHLPKSNKT